MPASLPPSPSLEHLKKQARELLRAYRSGDSHAADRLRRHLPRLSEAMPPQDAVRLSEAQWVIAREHGFPSWPKLKRYIESVTGPQPPARRAFVRELSWYEDRAAGLVSVHRGGLPSALRIIREFHPRFHNVPEAEVRASEFTLEDARLVYARQHGCESWRAFQRHLRDLESGETVEPFMLAFQAVEAGDGERLSALLEREPTLVNARGSNGNTLLALAASCKQVELCRSLLRAGADVDLGNDRGWTPLHQAGYSNQLELIELFLAAGAAVDREAHGEGGTPLMMALFWGHREASERLAEAAVVPNNLRTAAGLGRLETMRSFFNGDGTLKPAAGSGRGFYRPHSGFPVWTPTDDPKEILNDAFTYAARSGRTEALDLLLRMGAQIEAEPYNGTALHWAVAQGKGEAVRWLVERGAPINVPARFGGVTGVTPLHNAAWGGRLDMAKLLLELGADLSIRDPENHGLPWGWADYNGHPAVKEYLLEVGSQRSILYATALGRLDRVQALIDADPTLVHHYDGWCTPLLDAARRGHREIVELLLARGADPNVPDGGGKTALMWATESEHAAVVELLREHGAR